MNMPPDADILEKLKDLHLQATTDRSHYYTANLLVEAMKEIIALRKKVLELLTPHV